MIVARIESRPASGRWLVLLLSSLFLAGCACLESVRAAEPARGQGQLPSDLDLVPRDAAGFVHLRAVNLWNTDLFADVRHLLDRAGPEAWRAFEKKCPLPPATIERITLIMLTPRTWTEPFPDADPEALSSLVVVRTAQPYNRVQLIEALGSREKTYLRQLYYFNEDLWSGMILIDPQTFMIGSEDALVRFFDVSKEKKTTGPLQAALEEAAGQHQVVVGINPPLLAKEVGKEMVSGPLQPLLDARAGMVAYDFSKNLTAVVRLDFSRDDEAEAGAKALRAGMEMARQGLAQPIRELEQKIVKDANKKAEVGALLENFGMMLALGWMREVDTMLKEAAVERKGTIVRLPWSLPAMYNTYSTYTAISLVAVSSLGRNARGRFSTVAARIGGNGENRDPLEEHLKLLAQAIEKYHDAKGCYPAQALNDEEGRPLLSWRVALLPYLGEDVLYKEFRLDEPWDSLHNKKLIKKMPKAFQSLDTHGPWNRKKNKTQDQVFVGAETLFSGKKIKKTDVGGQTVILAHVGDDQAVYWTKPADLPYAADKDLPNLFGEYGGSFRVLLTDGSVRTIQRDTDEKPLRALIKRK